MRAPLPGEGVPYRYIMDFLRCGMFSSVLDVDPLTMYTIFKFVYNKKLISHVNNVI